MATGLKVRKDLSANHSGVISYLNLFMVGVVVLVVLSLVVEYGFYLPNETRVLLHRLDFLIVGLFVGEFFIKMLLSGQRKHIWQTIA